jgi:hypothetical protein
MRIVVAIAGFLLLATAIADAFQTVIVARHAQKLPRITRLFYQFTWILLRAGAAHSVGRTPRKLSRPVRAIIPTDFAWFLGYRPDRRFRDTSMGGGLGKVPFSFARSLYLSAGTFFTLGSSEPQQALSRFLMVIEAGLGFTFLGFVIGYLPVLYQLYSSRELRILFLDARAGSPPSQPSSSFGWAAILRNWKSAWPSGRVVVGLVAILLSDAGLLSVTACQPVLAQCAHCDCRCQRAGRYRWRPLWRG